MEVEYAFLADAAVSPPDGKLYVLGGGIDEIRASSFPAIHPYVSLVVKLKLHPTECERQHQLEIELWDSDGHRIGPQVAGAFSAARRPIPRPTFVQLVLNVVGAQFPRPGAYDFHIVVNDQHLKTVPVFLVETPPQVEPAQPSPGGDRE